MKTTAQIAILLMVFAVSACMALEPEDLAPGNRNEALLAPSDTMTAAVIDRSADDTPARRGNLALEQARRTANIHAGEHDYEVTDQSSILFHTLSLSSHTAYNESPWASAGCHVMRNVSDWKAPAYVDYNHEMLIAVTMGNQSDRYGEVQITNVQITATSLKVQYAAVSVDRSSPILSHPHHLIRLPRTNLPVKFSGPELAAVVRNQE